MTLAIYIVMSYLIIRPDTYSGMGSYIWQVLRAMFHYPDVKYYIDFSTSIYADDTVKNTGNVWEYFFEQPHFSTIPEGLTHIGTVGNIEEQSSEYRDVYMLNPSPQIIAEKRNIFNSIIKKNIRLLPHIQHIIDDFVAKEFTGKRILGVHLRGTDHPEKSNIEVYIEYIRKKENEYDKIFVCSDEQDRVSVVQEVFGEKVITYNSVRSTTASASLHHTPTNTAGYRYKIAEDVIVEAYILARTNFLLCLPNSNVNYLARAINPDIQSESCWNFPKNDHSSL